MNERSGQENTHECTLTGTALPLQVVTVVSGLTKSASGCHFPLLP